MPLYFKEYGKGFPVILLHGLCETHAIWNNFANQLAAFARTRVLCPDLPGFGESEILPGGFSIRDVGCCLLQWLQSLQIEKCVLVGHSLGGYVALSMIKERPDIASGLMLFNSTAFADTEEKRKNRDKVMAFIEHHGVQPYIDTFVPGLFYQKDHPAIGFVHGLSSQTSKEALMGYLRAMRNRPDQTDTLTAFQGERAILAGQFDGILPINALKEQARLVQAHCFVLENTGHMAMIEEPQESLKTLNSFIATTLPRQTS